MPPGLKERPFGEPCLPDVLEDSPCGREVEPNPPMLVALFMEGDRRLVTVPVKVSDLEPADGANPGRAVEEELDDGTIAVIEDRITRGEAHELPGTGRREGFGLITRVRGSTRGELSMGRVRHGDREPELGGHT